MNPAPVKGYFARRPRSQRQHLNLAQSSTSTSFVLLSLDRLFSPNMSRRQPSTQSACSPRDLRTFQKECDHFLQPADHQLSAIDAKIFKETHHCPWPHMHHGLRRRFKLLYLDNPKLHKNRELAGAAYGALCPCSAIYRCTIGLKLERDEVLKVHLERPWLVKER